MRLSFSVIASALRPDANSHARWRGAWVSRISVSRDGYRFRLALNINTDTVVLGESQNPVFLDPVVVPLECRLRLLAEENSYFAAGANVVVANHIVGITMPNGDAIAFAALR